MTKGRFVVGLVAEVPEARSIVVEHLDDNFGEVLLHLLVARVRDHALAAWERGDSDVVDRYLTFVDTALAAADEDVDNAICVSFVEDICWYKDPGAKFVEEWPPALAAEVARQRAWDEAETLRRRNESL